MTDKFQNKYRIPSARLPNWDYRWNAAYFVTICTQNRECYFGNVVNDKMQLSEIGHIAQSYWQEIPKHFPFVLLDAFIIMPNHMHGIIVIDKQDNAIVETLQVKTLQVKTLHATSLPIPKKMAFISPKQGSLSTIIRSYKSAVTKNARQIHADFAWQSRFHDHIIRNNKSFQTISEYIVNNPMKWEDDKFYIL